MASDQTFAVAEGTPARTGAPSNVGRVLRATALAAAAGVAACLGVAWASLGAGLVLGAMTGLGALLLLLAPVVGLSSRARAASERRSATAVLDALGNAHVVVHGLRLPRTRIVIDHLVIGPTGVWVIGVAESRVALRAETLRYQAAAVQGMIRIDPALVHAVLVLVGEENGDGVLAPGVAFLRADDLGTLAGSGPTALTPSRVQAVAARLRLPQQQRAAA